MFKWFFFVIKSVLKFFLVYLLMKPRALQKLVNMFVDYVKSFFTIIAQVVFIKINYILLTIITNDIEE